MSEAEALLEVVKAQQHNIEKVVEGLETIDDSIRARPTRGQTMWIAVMVSVVLAVITLLFVGFLFTKQQQVQKDVLGSIARIENNAAQTKRLVEFVDALQAELCSDDPPPIPAICVSSS